MSFLQDLFSSDTASGVMAGAPLGPWGMLAGGLLGMSQGRSNRANQESQAKLAATTQELSPWTGMQAQPVQQAPSPAQNLQKGLGTMLEGYQNLDNKKAMSATQAAKLKYMQSMEDLNKAQMNAIQSGKMNPWG